MLNFTGSSKKRVVNLGEKRSTRGKNYLEQARLDRIQREESRLREKCAQVLQSYIRRRLDLMIRANDFKQQWTDHTEVFNWDIWAAQFVFVCRFGRRKDAQDLLPRLKEQIAQLRDNLNTRAQARLIGGLFRLLDHSVSPQMVLSCLSDIISIHGVPVEGSAEWTGIIKKLLAFMGLDNQKQALDLIFAFNRSDSLHAFLNFVANVPPEYLENSHQYSQVFRNVFSLECVEVILKFTDIQKTQLLVNVLNVGGPDYSNVDYLVHASIISTMNFSVKVQSDNDEEDLVQESRVDAEVYGRGVTVSEKAAHVLLVLYSSSYITHAIGQLQHSGTDTKLAVLFISLLMYLFPESRTKLCMMMTIMPGLDHWMFVELSTHPAFVEFKKQGKEKDAMSMETLLKIFALEDVTLFLNLLHTYEQLLSYWLIVANDLESFNGDRFTRNDMYAFAEFLKILCLTLIFRTNDNMSNLPQEFTRLKDISVSLLNQFYIRNLRLKYLPTNFWTLKSLKFETDSMIQIVLDYEELRKEMEDFSSDEESERRPSISKPRHRTPDMASKLEVLNKVPFFVNFTDRVRVLQSLIDAELLLLEASQPWLFFDGPHSTKLAADIYRENLLESSFERFNKVGAQFKNKLQITFHNEHGVEAGIDGGGLTKEFLTSVVTDAFSTNNALKLFRETEADNDLYPNHDIYLKILKRIDLPEQQIRLQYMRFLGMIVGKCLYEHVLIDVAFAPFFLAKWRVAQNSMKNSINDLKFLDRDLYQNLNKLLEMSEEQIQQLDLDFTINEHVDSDTLQYDLQPPHGETIKVTSSNRLNYIHQIANFKLNQSLHIQTKYFLEGLFELINATWLNMFDPYELQMLISGGNDVNIKDWKENVLYGGYFDDDVTVVLFWQVVEEMSPQERCDLIKFVTSVSRAPLLGFGALSPKFGIHNSGPSNRLPTASTCVNLLKLPDYKDKDVIRQKLLYSISANSGFDLS